MISSSHPTAYIAPSGTRIVIRGDLPGLLDFARSLPNCRTAIVDGIQTINCTLTPAAAYRVSQFIGIELLPPLDTMAREFWADVQQAQTTTRDHDPPQPNLRKGDDWRHQRQAYWFSQFRDDASLLGMGMGTGKSRVAINCAVNWDCRRILVLCPKSVIGVWRREFPKHSAIPYTVVALDSGTVAKKTDAAALAFSHPQPYVAVVLNYESAKVEPFASWAASRDWDLVIADESHRAADAKTQTNKFLCKLKAKRRLMLSGTPLTQTPLAIFGQAKFLDPGVFGTSWTQFKARYAICANPNIPQQITGYQRLDELQERTGWLCYHCTADVLDLPPVQHETRSVVLGTDAQRIYRQLESDLIAEVDGGVVTAEHALTKLLRLQQCTSGYAVLKDTYSDQRREKCIDAAKFESLTELLEDIDESEPVVIFCRFKHDLQQVLDAARGLGRKWGELSGRFNDLTPEATLPEDVRIFGVQIQSGGLGVDFSRARYAVYFSLGFSLVDYEQSQKRVHRPGQTRPTTYYHLVADGTVDQYVYRALRQRRDVIEAVLDGMRQSQFGTVPG